MAAPTGMGMLMGLALHPFVIQTTSVPSTPSLEHFPSLGGLLGQGTQVGVPPGRVRAAFLASFCDALQASLLPFPA